MVHNKIPVACVQMRAHDRVDFDAAWPHVVANIDAAARGGARLIVLPEATVPGYVLGYEAIAVDQLERAAKDVAERARRFDATIVYGGVKLVDGRTLNAAIVVGPDGCELGYAAKQFLWHFDRRWFAGGTTLEPIDTPLGRLGVLVCADGRIPTIAATLVERGAQILVMPTAWVTSGRDPSVLENLQADLMANVRARENGVPFAIANKCGVELQSVAYCGKSALIDADGRFVARGSERSEEIVFGELELSAQRSGVAMADDRLIRRERDAPAPLRVAFTTARGNEIGRFAALAADADADILFARSPGPTAPDVPPRIVDVGPRRATIAATHGLEIATVDSATFHAPRGLTQARLCGYDLFVWHAPDDAVWNTAFARTRAAELRAYVVVFASDDRAFAVDPDGTVVAGTFDDFRVATFVYDRARTAATQVAPTTDVLAGLRAAEAIRAGGVPC